MSFSKKKNSNYTEVFPGYTGRFVHGEGITIAHWDIKAGSKIPEHRHHHEQVVNCLSGKFNMIIDGKEYLMEGGDTVMIPPNALHSAIALTDAQCLDVFTPIREDYRI